MNQALVRYSNDGGIALLAMAAPEQNTLTEELVEALYAALLRFDADGACRAAILYGVDGVFSVGADPRQIGSLYNSDAARLVVDGLNRLNKPVVALLSGPVQGGALEIALACHERLATTDARLSFPEIRLGLPPGAGATQHLPRLIDTASALTLLTDGTTLDAQQAFESGLVSAVSDHHDLATAIDLTRSLLKAGYYAMPVCAREFRQPGQIKQAIAAHRNRSEMRSGEGFEAILACLEVAATRTYEEGYQFELEAYQRCETSPVRAAINSRIASRNAAQWRSPAVDRQLALPVHCVTVIAPQLRADLVLPTQGQARLVNPTQTCTPLSAPPGTAEVLILDATGPADVALAARLAGPRDVVAYLGSPAGFAHALEGLENATRWVLVHTDGGQPRSLFQPVPRDDLAADVLPTLVQAARSLGFVVLHANAEAPLGALLLADWQGAVAALRQAGAFNLTASDTPSYQECFELNEHGNVVLPLAEPGPAAASIDTSRFLLACALINSGCRLLDKKQALHPEDIDLLTGFGYGFAIPAYGPMLWALKIGLPKVLACLNRAQAQYGAAFDAAKLLRMHGGDA